MQLVASVAMWSSLRARDRRCQLADFSPIDTESTTRRLSATDHVILNHGQVTWTTHELAPPLLTTTPTGGRFSSRQIYCASLPYTVGL
ncbi:hypothetical protein TNCV_4726091 [Trichonephila clavipes]|nr:hypothetical protein TNCV_4726091 [Trichonephila clavipes]